MRKLAMATILAAFACLVVSSGAKADFSSAGLIIAGSVNANGTSQHYNNSFTIAHPSTGYYIITFSPWVFGTAPPVCLVTPLGAGFSVAAEFYDVGYCKIYLENQSGLADTIFLFMAAPATVMPRGR